MLRCVHPELGDRPIVFQRSDDEEEEQRGEEERHGEEAENVGEGSNEEEDESEEEEDESEEAEVERVTRQTWRSHMIAPPIVPAREEDRVLIKPLDDR
jgi:hypothetical protein